MKVGTFMAILAADLVLITPGQKRDDPAAACGWDIE